ncbi:MAG: hypothetical protein V8S27_04705 [Lachnospiraceae bacterium]
MELVCKNEGVIGKVKWGTYRFCFRPLGIWNSQFLAVFCNRSSCHCDMQGVQCIGEFLITQRFRRIFLINQV